MTPFEFRNNVSGISHTMRPFALNLTNSYEAANDLIQDTIYKALINEDKFKDGTNLKAWLYTIMKNIFINDYRRKVRQNTTFDNSENLHLLNSVTTSNQAEANFVFNDISFAIDNLIEDYKVPFMMYCNGFKYQEIADDLRLPLGTVKSRIFFARQELKQRLAQYQFSKN